MKTHTFFNDTYNAKFHFFAGHNQKQLQKAVTKLGHKQCPDIGNSAGMVFHYQDSICIWVESERKTVENLSYLVHECVHAVNELVYQIGAKLDVNNDEFQAYATQWLFRKCVEKLK